MAEQLSLALKITATDSLSAPVRRMQQMVRGLSRGVMTMGRRMRTAGSAIRGMAKRFAEASKGFQLSANLRQAGEAAGRVGRTLRSMLTGPIKISEEFAAKMTDVRAVMRLAADDPSFKTLTKEAERLGFTIGEFTMTDAARGMEIMAIAGRDAGEVMKALPVTLDLSTAAGLDFAETTDIMLDIMGGFELQVEDTARVADVLAATFTSSKVDLQKLGETFRYVAPMAELAKLSFEDASIVAGVLGNSGIDASVAGTTMTQMLIKLMAQTPKTTKALDDLRVKAIDPITGEIKTPVRLMGELGAAMEGMANPKIVKNMFEIFGTRGLKGGAKILRALGGARLEKITKAVTDAKGLATEIAQTKRQTAINETKQMTSAMESLGKVLGDELAPELKWLKALVKDTATGLAEFSREYPLLTKVVMITVGALALLTTGLTSVLFGTAAVSAVVNLLYLPAMFAAATATWAFLAPIAVVAGAVAVFAAVGAAAVLLTFYVDETSNALADFFQWMGMGVNSAALFSTAVVTAFEVMLAPILAVVRGIKAAITLIGKLSTLTPGSMGKQLAPRLFGRAGVDPGFNMVQPAFSMMGQGGGGGEIGGELRITVDQEARVVGAEVSKRGPMDFSVVDAASGFSMLGGI